MARQRKSTENLFIVSKKRLQGRIFFIGIFFLVAICYMSYHVAAIKLKNGEDYQKQVLNRMIGQESQINPQRGDIVDRNNKIIAASVLAYDIILDPKTILGLKEDEQQTIYRMLSSKLNKSQKQIMDFVIANKNSRYSVLAKKVDDQIIQKIKKEGLKGVWFEEGFIRKYPKGEFAAQLTGFFNKNGEGQYGIEQQFNSYMVGKPGRVFSQMQDEQIVTTEMKAAEKGAKVVLTIDEVIQQYVETTMKKYIDEYHPIDATAIIMNPNTGEVYSMFSYPNFNPNQYNVLQDQLGKEKWDKLTDKEKSERLNTAWKNYNIQLNYEPGSTMKPLVVAAALDESVINTNQKYYCKGSIVVADGVAPIHCWKLEGHGEETLEEVLANSCNVGMIELGSKISPETFMKYMKRYGFGQSTQIGLPGEEIGLLHSKLGSVDRATHSIGQGFNCTPLQLITAFSSVINGGYLMQPYVVSNIISPNNDILYENKPTLRRQTISAETSQLVTSYLEKVVDDGTGGNAAVTGYNIGGKTGTAQKRPLSEKKYVLSFIGYAPVNNPQVVGLVVFDEIPEHSGVPAKAFRDMMTNILPYLEIELANSKQILDQETSKVPNLLNTDIYKASSLLENQNLDYEVIGVGKKIVSQYPVQGTYFPKKSVVRLYTKTETPDQIVQVPNLIGLSVQEAKQMVNGEFVISGTESGVISKQVPKAGQKIEKNSQIIVKTSD